jgi:N-acyl-D-amino-acid deacylase
MAAYDIVIRNGTVVDGTGSPGFEADIAIRDRLIVTVGKVTGTGAQEIEARGRSGHAWLRGYSYAL